MFAFGFHRVKVDRSRSSHTQMRRQRGRDDLGDFHNKHHNWTEASYLREPLGTGMVAQTWMAALQEQWHHHRLILNMFNTTVSLSTPDLLPAYGSNKAVYRLKLSLVIEGMYIYIIMEFGSIFTLPKSLQIINIWPGLGWCAQTCEIQTDLLGGRSQRSFRYISSLQGRRKKKKPRLWPQYNSCESSKSV